MKPYYQDKWVKIFHGDCREILPQLDVKVDLVLTDPPYGIDYAAHPIVGKGKSQSNHKPMEWDSSRFEDLVGILGRAGQSIIWGGNYYSLPLTKSWLVWYKRDAPPSMGDAELAWSNLGVNTQVFDCPIAAVNSERIGHPTQKPVALFCWCLAFVPNAKIILDPFLGSGTTCYCAKKLNRYSIGIEIEEKYCEIAAKRCCQEVMELNV
ncbi:MAG: site-specific DNA-methyltransferase [Bacteroidales bacterium]